MIFKKIYNAIVQINLSQLSLNFESCHLCGWKIQIKTNNDEMSVRCTRCFASPVSQSLGFFVKKHVNSQTSSIYELSSRGSFVRYLKKLNIDITLSEYFDGKHSGTFHNGVLCQNVENLTFPSDSFDICTSLEVFEHVKNDIKGFKEIYRVLKNGGYFIFTVPINLDENTIERTKIINGKRENILSPEYHSDSIRGSRKVFCYRNYGVDILDRLEQAGFKNNKIHRPSKSKLFGFGRPVIISQKI